MPRKKRNSPIIYLRSPCPSGSSWWSHCPSRMAAWWEGWAPRCTHAGLWGRRPRPRWTAPPGCVGGATWRGCGQGRWWEATWKSSPRGRHGGGCRPSAHWSDQLGCSCRWESTEHVHILFSILFAIKFQSHNAHIFLQSAVRRELCIFNKVSGCCCQLAAWKVLSLASTLLWPQCVDLLPVSVAPLPLPHPRSKLRLLTNTDQF